MIIKLGNIERINVRDTWSNEASQFNPWLALKERAANDLKGSKDA